MYADEAFKDKVKELAREVAQSQGWCRDGVNAVLSQLEIAPFGTDYTARLTLDLELTIDISGIDITWGEEISAIEQRLENNMRIMVADDHDNEDDSFYIESVSTRNVEVRSVD